MSNSKKLWSRFEKSGKLVDYLEYCKARREENKDRRPPEKDGDRDQSSL